LEEISGSTGLTGAVDGALILKRSRHSPDGTLELIRRDLQDARFALAIDDNTGTWQLTGEAPKVEEIPGDGVTAKQREIIDLVRDRGPRAPLDIAEALHRTPESVRQMVRKLAKRDLLIDVDGVYSVPHEATTSASENASTSVAADHHDTPHHTCLQANQGEKPVCDEAILRARARDGKVIGEETTQLFVLGPEDQEHGAKAQPASSTALSSVSTAPTSNATLAVDRTDAGADSFLAYEPGRRTPTSDLPFERGWRNPLALRERAENISRRVDWDTGCRTKVSLSVVPDPDDPGAKTVWLECGHGIIEEEVVYRRWRQPEDLWIVEDARITRMALAHHAYMCACDCSRPLWHRYFGKPLTTASAEAELWSAYELMGHDGYYVQTRFHERKWPPVPRWVEDPEETWPEDEADWPNDPV
jgi:hypothetical protein